MKSPTDATLALSNSLDRSLRSRSLSVCRTVFCSRNSKLPSSAEATSIALLLSDGVIDCESRAIVLWLSIVYIAPSFGAVLGCFSDV